MKLLLIIFTFYSCSSLDNIRVPASNEKQSLIWAQIQAHPDQVLTTDLSLYTDMKAEILPLELQFKETNFNIYSSKMNRISKFTFQGHSCDHPPEDVNLTIYNSKQKERKIGALYINAKDCTYEFNIETRFIGLNSNFYVY